MKALTHWLTHLLTYGLFFIALALPAVAQRYQTNDMSLAINSVTAGTASNSTQIVNTGGLGVSAYRLANPAAVFDVAVNFTCNTQVFWGATFLFSGSYDGATANSLGGNPLPVAQVQPQLFTIICPTNTLSVSNYTAVFRSTDTNIFCRPINWGTHLLFHGATNVAPTTLTINRVTVGQVQ